MNIDSVILSQFILPVITLSLGMCAYIIRLERDIEFIDVIAK